MAPFEEEVIDVVLDGKMASAFGVVPVDVNSGETGAGPVLGDIVVLEEDVTKVVSVAFSDVFDAEKSSTIKQKRMGRHLWRHRLGVMGNW